MSEKHAGNITRIITLLSPVEFEDGRREKNLPGTGE